MLLRSVRCLLEYRSKQSVMGQMGVCLKMSVVYVHKEMCIDLLKQSFIGLHNT